VLILENDLVMEKCWRCGHELICSSNFMLSDWGYDSLDEDDDALITEYSCPNCGAQYSVIDTPENEKKNYPYWGNNVLN